MPKRAPAKVAVSPKATRIVSWICPCGSMKIPQKRSTNPPTESTNAAMSCSSIFIFFKIRCKYAHNFGGFANFSPKSPPLYAQAYLRKASMLASVMGCPKHSMRMARCLSGMFCPQRWLSRSWISWVGMIVFVSIMI